MLTIWGSNAEKFQRYNPGCVVALKRGRITDYGGRSLDSSCLSSSTFKVMVEKVSRFIFLRIEKIIITG